MWIAQKEMVVQPRAFAFSTPYRGTPIKLFPPVGVFTFPNAMGLGSHFWQWNAAVCVAFHDMDPPHRIQSRTLSIFIYLDVEYCSETQALNESPLMCYLPRAERRCSEPAGYNPEWKEVRNPAYRQPPHCPLARSDKGMLELQAAGTEYLFQSVSPLVIQEAKRQVGIIFASVGGIVPEDIVTVHLRWGDKFTEMKLVKIEQYIEAVHIISGRSEGDNSTLPIFLATEDPHAYDAFVEAMPSNWVVYADIALTEMKAFRPTIAVDNMHAVTATKSTRGRDGLIAMGGLLVAMEARRFVLTTASNWSHLMEHLRTNIIDPRCGNCTRVIDLRPRWPALVQHRDG